MNNKLIKKILETAKIENAAIANLISLLPMEQREGALNVLFETAEYLPVANKSKIVTESGIKRTLSVTSENPLTKTVIISISEEAYVANDEDMYKFINGESVNSSEIHHMTDFPKYVKRSSIQELSTQNWLDNFIK